MRHTVNKHCTPSLLLNSAVHVQAVNPEVSITSIMKYGESFRMADIDFMNSFMHQCASNPYESDSDNNKTIQALESRSPS